MLQLRQELETAVRHAKALFTERESEALKLKETEKELAELQKQCAPGCVGIMD